MAEASSSASMKVDNLFAEHIGAPISAQVPGAVWSRLQIVFQQRQLLVHRQGIVDIGWRSGAPAVYLPVPQLLATC